LLSILNGHTTFNAIQNDAKISINYTGIYLAEMEKQKLIENKPKNKKESHYVITQEGEKHLSLKSLFDMYNKIDNTIKIFEAYKNPKRRKEFTTELKKVTEKSMKKQLAHLKKFRNGECAVIHKRTSWDEIIDKFPTHIYKKDILVLEDVPPSKEDYLLLNEVPPEGENIDDTDNMARIFSEYEALINDPEKSKEFLTQYVKDITDPLMRLFKKFFELMLYFYGHVENPQKRIATDYFFFGPSMQLLFNFDSRCLGDPRLGENRIDNKYRENSEEFRKRLTSLQDFCEWHYLLSGKSLKKKGKT